MDAEQMQVELKKMLHKVDLANRPYAIYCHPFNKAKILEAIPDLEEKCEIVELPFLDKEKIYLISRVWLESYPTIKFEPYEWEEERH